MRTYEKDLFMFVDRRDAGHQQTWKTSLSSAAGGIMGNVVIHGEAHGGNECH